MKERGCLAGKVRLKPCFWLRLRGIFHEIFLKANGMNKAKKALFLPMNGKRSPLYGLFWDEVMKKAEIISHFMEKDITLLFAIQVSLHNA
jgi:hypothetical protein